MLFVTKNVKEAIDEADSKKEYDFSEDLDSFLKLAREPLIEESEMGSDSGSYDEEDYAANI